MLYSIIIPTYNHLEDALRPCLDSVLKYTHPETAEIIVVANGCTDGTHEYLAGLKDAVRPIWLNKPMGYPKSVNAGIRAARGEYVVLLNNDTACLDQKRNYWLDFLREPFDDPQMAVVGNVPNFSNETERQFVIFCLAMIKREIFAKIGLLDESFHPGFGEDIEFCWRAERHGYKIKIVPPPEFRHFNAEANMWVCPFPFYHRGSTTFGDYEGQTIVNRNQAKLRQMYMDSLVVNPKS